MNMIGNLNIKFYLTDTDEDEMNDIMDEIDNVATEILLDYEIASEWDIEMEQDIQEVKSRIDNMIEYEKQGGSLRETFKQCVSFIKEKLFIKKNELTKVD